MKICWVIFASLLTVLQGCSHRPAGVPASAVKVDDVFIECSVEASDLSNRCTIYSADTGDVLSSGKFVLGSGREAQTADLQFAAFDGARIYLQDARVLYPLLPKSDHILENKLKEVAGNGAANCGATALGQDRSRASDCALSSFANNRPFYVYYIVRGANHPVAFGMAGDGSGNVLNIDHIGNYLDINPCPKPVHLRKVHDDAVICARSVLE